MQWVESLSNERCATNFAYRFLNEICHCKTCPSKNRKPGGPTDINSEFWYQLQQATTGWAKPPPKSEPSQCGLVKRLKTRRAHKYDELLVKKIESKHGIVFRTNKQRRRNLPCIWTEMLGKQVLWMLFQDKSGPAESSTVEGSRKRPMEVGDNSDDDLVPNANKEARPSSSQEKLEEIADFFQAKFDGSFSVGNVRQFLQCLEIKTGINLDELARPSPREVVIDEGDQDSGGLSALTSPNGGSIGVPKISPAEEGVNLTWGDPDEDDDNHIINHDDDDDDESATELGDDDNIPPINHDDDNGQDDQDDASVNLLESPQKKKDEEDPKTPTTRSSPRKNAGRCSVQNEGCGKQLDFDATSYDLVRIGHKECCSACGEESQGTFFECRNCETGHRVCMDCMEHGNDGHKYDLCHHNLGSSYCIQTRNQSWMSLSLNPSSAQNVGSRTKLVAQIQCFITLNASYIDFASRVGPR
jgi:hypothetical protein